MQCCCVYHVCWFFGGGVSCVKYASFLTGYHEWKRPTRVHTVTGPSWHPGGWGWVLQICCSCMLKHVSVTVCQLRGKQCGSATADEWSSQCGNNWSYLSMDWDQLWGGILLGLQLQTVTVSTSHCPVPVHTHTRLHTYRCSLSHCGGVGGYCTRPHPVVCHQSPWSCALTNLNALGAVSCSFKAPVN